jgi:hypothetical protein
MLITIMVLNCLSIDFCISNALTMIPSNPMSACSLQYYVITRRWASDLEFFKIETAFLHRLMEEYIIGLTDPAYIEKLKQAAKKLLKLERDEYRTEVLLNDQFKHVVRMAEDVILENSEDLTVNQVQLEYLITNLSFEFREVKKELFVLVENVMDENKMITGSAD